MTQPRRPDDERFAAWLDAEMDEPAREAFERELASDPTLRRDLASYQQTIEVLRRLPDAEAPAGFLREIQQRIRRRTRGRFYGVGTKVRFPYEAAFNLLLICVLLALYLMAVPRADPAPIPVDPATFQIDPGGMVAVEVLAPYGSPRRLEGVFEVVLDAEAWPKLEADLARYPQLELLGAPQPIAKGRLRVRVLPHAQR